MSIKHLQFDNSGTLEFGALTGSYQNLLALTDDVDVMFIYNATNAAMMFRVPSGVVANVLQYKEIRLPATSTISIDCRTNSKRIAKGTVQVKYASGAPTSGEVVVTVAR